MTTVGFRLAHVPEPDRGLGTEVNEMKADEAKKLASQAIEELAMALDDGHSESLTAYLAAMGRFHRYSLHNQILIAMQRPDATRVAGFQAWRQFGRHIKSGERGIAILAPIVLRRTGNATASTPASTAIQASEKVVADKNLESPIAFRTVHVFDISQTNGQPLPAFATARGDPGIFVEQLKTAIARDGIHLEFSNNLGAADGLSAGGKIILKGGLSPAETFSTLAHEYAHEKLHQGARLDSTSRRVRETEAEAVAFIVCVAVGIDTKTASSDYIQLYQGDRQTLTASLARIHQTATGMIASILNKDRLANALTPLETSAPMDIAA